MRHLLIVPAALTTGAVLLFGTGIPPGATSRTTSTNCAAPSWRGTGTGTPPNRSPTSGSWRGNDAIRRGAGDDELPTLYGVDHAAGGRQGDLLPASGSSARTTNILGTAEEHLPNDPNAWRTARRRPGLGRNRCRTEPVRARVRPRRQVQPALVEEGEEAASRHPLFRF